MTDPGSAVKLWGWYGNAAHWRLCRRVRQSGPVEFEALSDVHQLLHSVLAAPSADMSDSATAHFEDYLNRIHDFHWFGFWNRWKHSNC
jgi:predicted LPLAT superfamily acyltransferase